MGTNGRTDVDVVVVGAGMAGLYLLHRLRSMGLSAVALETADDVGGTWYWNRYPGARCDVMSVDYQYTFDPELEDEWEWSEKYATQPEILRYLQHVADKHDLRSDIRFETRVERAAWDDDSRTWAVDTSAGDTVTCRWYVMATGCLSAPKDPDIAGADRFGGEVYFTSRWPHEGVDLSGQRVGVIGTGSSAIQSIPIMAKEATELTVFQRTPNYSMPANNGAAPAERLARRTSEREAYVREARESLAGVPMPEATESALAVSEEERNRRYQAIWDDGHIISFSAEFMDLQFQEANDTVADFFRSKIRETVDDADVAESLCPTDYPVFTKRLCVDSGYYQTFNQPHVRLVDLRKDPLVEITETGVRTESGLHEFDVLVFATGFDAMTGAIVRVDIEGRDGIGLKDRWADGPLTYLGLMTAGFPNLFMVTGPQSPSVLSNMAVSIEQHVEWITDTIGDLRTAGLDTIEPTSTAEAGWVQHTSDFADLTLMDQANSWYVGANVPGKPRIVMPYVGGVGRYRKVCDEVVGADYLGFTRSGADGVERTVDGVVRQLQPDAMIVLEVMAEMGMPAFETLGVDGAREMVVATSAERPPGPDVGEIVDGTLPGAGGDLAYRLFRPATDGPHPVVVYFHGGGWLWGGPDSDEPWCRYLCVESDAVVVSVDYRHAPEDPFPAAADDALAAVRWVGDHAAELGSDPARLIVAGWSAGGNLTAVTCQRVRDEGGPTIAGQVMITPVTDYDPTRGSMIENDGY
ncbi:MAG: alpha/beta hydrolase fold domain-containing protein, partial [Actinomycetota bacterium]